MKKVKHVCKRCQYISYIVCVRIPCPLKGGPLHQGEPFRGHASKKYRRIDCETVECYAWCCAKMSINFPFFIFGRNGPEPNATPSGDPRPGNARPGNARPEDPQRAARVVVDPARSTPIGTERVPPGARVVVPRRGTPPRGVRDR